MSKAVAAVALILLLAAASYFTTYSVAEGSYPSGVFQLVIRDSSGNPVEGAVFHIYRKNTRELAVISPLHWDLSSGNPVSDGNGRITLFRENGGIAYGTPEWDLFWVIRFETDRPQYDCEIEADNFKTIKFSIWDLFESRQVYGADRTKAKTKMMIDGREVELRIYEFTFTLER